MCVTVGKLIMVRMVPPWCVPVIYRQLSHGVHPVDLAEEILNTVSRKKREVLLAHPIPRVALYIRSIFPSLFFAVVAAGVKDSAMAEQLQ